METLLPTGASASICLSGYVRKRDHAASGKQPTRTVTAVQENDVMRKPHSPIAHRPLPACLRTVSLIVLGALVACGRTDGTADTASSGATSDSAPASADESIILAT